MGKIYVGQESLEIRLDTGIDLTSALSVTMKYTKPDGTTGSWLANVYNTTWVQKIFINDANELDIPGTWILWSWANMSDSRSIPGEIVKYYVYGEGTS